MALVGTSEAPADQLELFAQAQHYIAAALAENTRRSYETGWAQFASWCRRHHREPMPAEPETVALYVADLAARLKPSTIDVRLAAVAAAHRAAGHESPTKAESVRLVRRGMRRTVGTAQRQVRPVTVDDLRAMVCALDGDIRGCRDRALLLIGFAAALRRAELVSLDVADVAETPGGLTVRVRRSKCDPEGEGRSIGVPYGANPSTCPVRAWRRWLEASGIESGPAFRPISRHGTLRATRLSDRAVAQIVKRHAATIGIDATEVSGHSLRAGLATAAAAAGVPEHVIARTTGHRRTETLRRYIREASLFSENAAAGVGL